MKITKVYARSRRFKTIGSITPIFPGKNLCFLLRCFKIWKLLKLYVTLLNHATKESRKMSAFANLSLKSVYRLYGTLTLVTTCCRNTESNIILVISGHELENDRLSLYHPLQMLIFAITAKQSLKLYKHKQISLTHSPLLKYSYALIMNNFALQNLKSMTIKMIFDPSVQVFSKSTRCWCLQIHIL